MTEKEVQQVLEALDAVERIADPEERSRAQMQITTATRERSALWAKERGELARRLQSEGVSVRGIANRLGVKPSTVQDLLRNYKGSGRDRPLANERKPEEPS
ncbi:helix-turn-helix domain-containing protein [Streptomyces albidoflavus]